MIWEDVLRRFEKEADIRFAYPAQRVYLNQEDSITIQPGPNK